MKKVCHNEISAIYDDGKDNWIVKRENKTDLIYPKKDDPILPLAAVTKYEMEVDDEEIIEQLRNKATELMTNVYKKSMK